MCEIISLNCHLAKWNPGAKNPGPNFNPYRDHILVVEISLIFFCVRSAVLKKNCFLSFPQDAEGMGGVDCTMASCSQSKDP